MTECTCVNETMVLVTDVPMLEPMIIGTAVLKEQGLCIDTFEMSYLPSPKLYCIKKTAVNFIKRKEAK
jgi:hypothetical protein